MNSDKKRRSSKNKRHATSMFRDFRQEIFIGALFLLGVFLLIEDLDIKVSVYHGFVYLSKHMGTFANNILTKSIEGFKILEGSDIVGVALIIIAINLFIYRIRHKFVIRYGQLPSCPDCGEELNLIHRNFFHRIVGFVFRVKIRRYACKVCAYEGLTMRLKTAR